MGSMRFTVRALAPVAVVSLALASTASCAAIWGFEPLEAAATDGGVADATAANDATPTSDAAVVSPVNDGASAPDVTAPSTLTCVSSNGTCSCNSAGTGNSAGCSASALAIDAANVVCCADPSYPGDGACRCQWVGCQTTGNQCICGPGYGKPGGSCAPGSWTCCIQQSAPGCVCSAGACLTGYTPHGNSCAIADTVCGGAEVQVASCR